MLVYVEIVHMYLENFLYSLSKQEEACKDKMCAGKTLCRVSHCEVCLHAVLVSEESDSVQC